MKEIKCPHCGKVFNVDEADYASIVSQVKNQEFHDELEARLRQAEEKRLAEQKVSLMEVEKKHEEKLADKNSEISKRDNEIRLLRTQISNIEKQKRLELEARLAQKEKELQAAEAENRQQFQQAKTESDQEILRLQAMVNQGEDKLKMAVMEAEKRGREQISDKEQEIIKLKGRIESADNAARLNVQTVREQYEQRLKEKEELIAFYKDLKSKASTKMLGETLEQHCSVAFNSVRASMFPKAYFEKDNDLTKGGTKGDFIFRDYEDGTEYISIMFEMKNEADATISKHKNEDFLQKLDKDRNDKGCEYAVLVTLLEPDNELYNEGIVDVSYKYPKMYVVRPQFFMPIISLLTNASRQAAAYKKELVLARQQNIDVTGFEDKLLNFQEGFSRNFDLAKKQYEDAIAEIDHSIAHLQKVRDALTSSGRNYRLANDKVQDLTIRKLTYKNPTMKKLFEEARPKEVED